MWKCVTSENITACSLWTKSIATYQAFSAILAAQRERRLLSLIPRSSVAGASGWMSFSSNLQWVALNTLWGLHQGVRLVCRVLFASVCSVMDAISKRRLFGNVKHRAKYLTRLRLFRRLSRSQIYRPAASQPGQQLCNRTTFHKCTGEMLSLFR